MMCSIFSNTGLEELDLNSDFISDYTSALNGDFNNPVSRNDVSKDSKFYVTT